MSALPPRRHVPRDRQLQLEVRDLRAELRKLARLHNAAVRRLAPTAADALPHLYRDKHGEEP